MQITSAFAAPRKVVIAGDVVWVPPLRLEDFALLIEWLEEQIEGRGERDYPPAFSADESWGKLTEGDGIVTIAYAVLRHQGWSWLKAAKLMIDASPEERQAFFDAALSRRRGRKVESGGTDIASLFWGPAIQAVCEKYHITVRQVGLLTLDQFDLLTQEGCKDEQVGAGKPMTIEDVMDMWADSRSKWEADHPEEAKNAPA